MPHKDPEKHRAYQREYKRRWIRENKEKHLSYVRSHKTKMQQWFLNYKKSLSCEICGENHPACLDFHHLNPQDKKFDVGQKNKRPSKETLIKEIAKCQVLCSNCHRKLHWQEREAKEKEAVE